MSTTHDAEASMRSGPSRPTLASTWYGLTASRPGDELLEWPPDLFAFTDVVLGRSEVYRFALSPPVGIEWSPLRFSDWSQAVRQAARQWSAWVVDRLGPAPELLTEEWAVVREGAETALERLAEGEEWRLCEALLTVHAIADEACAGLGVLVDLSGDVPADLSGDDSGARYRARGRELLARTGSQARVPTHCLRVLPKVRTPPTGRASFSRYACVQDGGIDVAWHKTPTRYSGIDVRAEHANLLLLPWPMLVRSSDFRPVEGSVRRLAREPFGFFAYAPHERLDLDLVDRMLVGAREEVDHVDVVVLPESSIDQDEVDDLEAVLDSHGVTYLHAGIRGRPRAPGLLPRNWVHTGVNPRLQKGSAGSPGSSTGQWFHIRQLKHHRWSLDQSQIAQYHLGGTLHPHIRWWEAMELPRRSVQFVEIGELTLVSLVCEDLAEQDEVAEVIRNVGPTVLVTLLLDGPQLSSRWAARYASVFADDPGSAVLTLTSYGMVERCRPHGHDVAPIVALWRDPAGGTRQIALEPGAQGVLLAVCGDTATRRSADGRWPVDDGTSYFDVAVHQVRPSSGGSGTTSPTPGEHLPPVLELEDLTVLAGWAESIAEGLAEAPGHAEQLLAEAQADASWRAAFRIPAPSRPLADALASVGRMLEAAASPGDTATFDAVLTEVREPAPGEGRLDQIARRVLRSTLEQVRSQQMRRTR
jgi:hypothetical protein